MKSKKQRRNTAPRQRKAAKGRSNRGIPLPVRCILWGRAAGRCQFFSCNRVVHRHPETQETTNLADVAHIIGFSKDGPRGEKHLSDELAKNIDNLMLLCKACHGTIDDHPDQYPNDRLQGMKVDAERRIELQTSIAPQRGCHVLHYCANVGQQRARVTFQDAAKALLPDRYPVRPHPTELGVVNSALKDQDEAFWNFERKQLEMKFVTEFLPLAKDEKADHVAVFAIAPQPLLMLLGHLLSDITRADVFQLHREPATWEWQPGETDLDVRVEVPKEVRGDPALVLAFSAPITDDRVLAVVPDATIWRMTISNPHNDFLRSREQLQVLREWLRPIPDWIRAQHGTKSPVHVFPAMPVAAAVEFGRIIMPKAAMDFAIYDENGARGGFAYALTLSPKPTGERRG